MQLSRKILPQLNTAINSSLTSALFTLPEKVVQFGTGVLLRGLPDYFIDKANKQNIFNGSIVMVKSTNGDTDSYESQDGLYTQCIRGIYNNEIVEEYVINASVSRVLSARSQWKHVLQCAADPNLEVIISNTTEVGIVLVEDDNIKGTPPVSFPGKLLAFLYERYRAFNADVNKGLVIVPTELITDNGSKLLSIVIELAHLNKLDYGFIDWLENANFFCNSLVDRIVPVKLNAAQQKATEAKLGYSDDLMIMSEVYRLWAIESSNPRVKAVLSFANVDEGVVIDADINRFRELKLRLLNGTHTFSCGLAFLAGFKTVREAMDNNVMGSYIHDLMMHEIAPCIINKNLSASDAQEFARNVIDRFRNPFLDHKWLSITMQCTHKMKMRNVPLLLKHYEEEVGVPEHMALGFAAYLLFMRCEMGENGNYYGEVNGEVYELQDNQATYFHTVWQNRSLREVVQKVLANQMLWEADLNLLPGFAFAVERYLGSIMNSSASETLKAFEKNRNKLERHEA